MADPGTPGVPADPEAVRDGVERLLADPRYSYEPSLVERALDWLFERLEDLLPGGEATAGSFGGGVGSIVAWLLIVVAVVVAVLLAWRTWRTRVRRPPADDAPLSELEVEHRRSARDWSDDAAAHEAAGRWDEAVRARYRALVRTLVDRRQLPDVPGRTTGELRGDLAATTPGASAGFERATQCFELVWYAGLPAGPAEAAVVRDAAAEVLAAPARTTVDRPDPVGAAR